GERGCARRARRRRVAPPAAGRRGATGEGVMSVLHVVFSVAGAEYVLSAEDVLQMESFEGATPVPGSLPYVAGVIQVRGRVVPVVDLRARFGLPPGESSIERRVVVGQVNDRTVGLLVDVAREVVKLA